MRLNRTEQYLTVHEIAKILRLSTLTIYKYIKNGTLQAVEFGGHYRISETALQSFIEEHRLQKKGAPHE